MSIVRNVTDSCLFRDLDPGDYFSTGGTLHLKIQDERGYNAVLLDPQKEGEGAMLLQTINARRTVFPKKTQLTVWE